MVTDIQINTKIGAGSYPGGGGVTVKVSEENPWDRLSKAFKKYTHAITYPRTGGSRGQPSDYSITLVGPRSTSGSNEFMYKKLEQWVEDVEIYFSANDQPSIHNPLIVGFVSRNWRSTHLTKGCPTIDVVKNGSKCYYTWSYLTSKEFDGKINEENAISEKDLIHGLLEDLGLTTGGGGTGKNKVVIRLDQKPAGDSESKYPESAYFTQGEGRGDSSSSSKDEDEEEDDDEEEEEEGVSSSGTRQVKVTKETEEMGYAVEGFDAYEHKFVDGDTVSELYVSYENNSRLITVGSGLGHAKIASVSVYYEAGTTTTGGGNTKNPVLITFTLIGTGYSDHRDLGGDGNLYAYSYQDFVNDLKTKPSDTKSITSSDVIAGGTRIGLKPKLEQEKERLRPLIEFKGGSGSNENVTTKGPETVSGGQGVGGEKFKKVTMTPITNDPDVPGGKSVGPWRVYNDYLIGYEKGVKIGGGDGDGVLKDTVTTDVTSGTSNKYSSITVYYSTKTDSSDYGDYKALLVQFDGRDTGTTSNRVTKTYIRRGNRKGTKWERADGIRIGTGGGDESLVRVLKDESNKLKQITFVTGTGSSSGGHDNITTTGPTRIDGHGIPGGHEFMKVTMTPNLGGSTGSPGERGVPSGQGSPDGPWKVYNDHLISKEPGMKIPDGDKNLAEFFTKDATSSSSKKYSSITVYYSSEIGVGNYKALLVEFDDYGSKTYIKRLNEKGTKWERATDFGIRGTGSDSELLNKLKELREKMRPLISFEKGNGRKNNEHITTHTQDVGKGVVGQDRYRFQKVMMTVNADDRPGGQGSSVGPWRVYNTKLFTGYEEGAKIGDGDRVLDGITTTSLTDRLSASTGSKYQSITVYYAVTVSGSRSKYKALLVEFVPGRGCGKKKYIKRGNKNGTTWESPDLDAIGTSNTGVTVQLLTEIGIDAGIITGATVIIGGGRAYVSKVDEEKHWDPLSKAFKKYTHSIEYPQGSVGYQASNYKIIVYGPSGSGSNAFTYKYPMAKVKEVEVYFSANASPSSSNPLVVGFVHESTGNSISVSISKGKASGRSSGKCYYTWSELTTGSSSSNSQASYIVGEWIKENDLITRLLEELGRTVSSLNRKNKLVIRLGEQSNNGKYPGSGYYSDKQVTLSKEPLTGRDTGLTGFEKYEHSVSGSVRSGDFDGFYFSYENNSMYIVTGSWVERLLLKSVTVYYDDGSGKGGGDLIRKPVLFVFHFKGTCAAYVYKYSEFINDLKKVTAGKAVSIVGTASNVTTAKIITGSGRLQAIRRDCRDGDSEFLDILKAESKRLERLITFVQRNANNEHITTVKHTVGQGQGMKFQKYTMKPNADDAKGGTSVGPWKVFSSQLFTNEKGKTIDEGATMTKGVLNDIYTTASGRSGTSTGQKYRSISVYYSLGSRALLIEFIKADGTSTDGPGTTGDGDKIYIKIEKEALKDGATKWVTTNAGEISTVDAGVLTKIAKEAGIIEDISTVTAKEIRINTDKTKGFYSSDVAGVTVKVTAESPWDKLSKIFKKYVHTIQYTGGGGVGYKACEYNITLYSTGPGVSAGPFGSGFTLNTPNPKVDKVELYFWANDKSNGTPLIVGFIHCSDSTSDRTGCSSSDSGCNGSVRTVDDSSSRCTSGKCYYTWSELTTRAQYDCTINVDPISENDLVTRLLEVIGTSVPGRKNKLVIRLGEQPSGGDGLLYPGSGHYLGKIKVKKESNVPGYDEYEHTIDKGSTIDEFYVTYKDNSRYFKVDSGLGSGRASLEKVNAYFDTGGTNRLVLITFSFKDGSSSRIGDKFYWYSYHDFVNELKPVKAINSTAHNTVKTITDGEVIIDTGGSGLEKKLHEEKERLVQLISFVMGDDSTRGGQGNQNVTTSELQKVGPGYTFKQVTMTPKTDDKAGGFDVGPWTVYNDYLLGYEKDAKIQDNDGVLTSVYTGSVTDSKSKKYQLISVYYAVARSDDSGEYMALLVKFVKAGSRTDGSISGDGETKYYKRTDRGGTQWADATGEMGSRIGIGGDDTALVPILQAQWNKFRPLIEFKKGSGRGTTGRENVRQEGPTVVKGQDSAGLGGDGQDTVGSQGSYRFIKYTMTPDTSKAKGGPWEVYSEHLLVSGLVLGHGSVLERALVFNFGHKEKIDEKVFESAGIFTDTTSSSTSGTNISSSKKYSSINVYYGTKVSDNSDYSSNDYVDNYSVYRALLLEFVPGSTCGRKTYIKRTATGGIQWAKTDRGDSINTSGDTALVETLTRIAKDIFATVARGPGGGGGNGHDGDSIHGHGSPAAEGSSTQGAECAPCNTDSPGSQDGNLAATVGGSIAGVGGVGGITGIVVYKNLEAVSGLIGRIAGR